MTYTNKAMLIRRELFRRICEIILNVGDLSQIDRIPYEMRPKNRGSMRCCVHKDRAVLRYKLLAILGHDPNNEEDELKRLEQYARESLNNNTDKPVLSVVDEACSSCVRKNYLVTNACKGCVARPCQMNCPKEAIEFHNGRAFINPDRCVNCGLCMKACPYHAIIFQPVPCEEVCPVNAIYKDDSGNERIDDDKCIHCGKCLQACPFGAVVENSDLIKVAYELKQGNPLIAMPAPSIVGQYNTGIAEVKVALKEIGFSGVKEVAQGAEITAEKEAKELEEKKKAGELLTTSCCPAYVELVKKHLPQLEKNVSTTKSPMVYTSRQIREEYPEAKSVFMGPCVAKRKEAENTEEVDYVLSFEEVGALFMALGIDVSGFYGEMNDEASKEAREFAFSGGVTEAVMTNLNIEEPIKKDRIDGLDKKSLRRMKRLSKEKPDFLEVMACEDGCAGGPTSVVSAGTVKKKMTEMFKKNLVG